VNSIPIHLYLLGEGRGEVGVLEAARYAAENIVSAVWIDVSDSDAVDLCKTLIAGSPLSVIGFVHDPSLIGDVLDAGVSGIAVHPAAGSALVGHKEAFLKNRTGIFLVMDDSTPGSYTGGLAADSREAGPAPVDSSSIDGGDGNSTSNGSPNFVDAVTAGTIPEDFLKAVNDVAVTSGMLKDEGFDNVYVHIHHSNPVLLFNVNRFFKDRFGTKHVVSMTCDSAREQSLIQNSLSLGSLFHEGIGDVLLIAHSDEANSDDGHNGAAVYDTGEEGTLSSYSVGNGAWAYSGSNRRSFESLQESILFAVKILGSCKLFPKGYTIISCPTCGRCRLDLLHITREIDNQMKTLEEQFNSEGKKLEDIGGISVAVMGCNVNGPGEARNADIGIAGRNNKTGVLFKNGKPFKSLPEKRLVSELIKHTRAIIEHKFETV